MRRDLHRVRHWIRGLVLAVIALLGLVAIVGSGGGGFLECKPPDCDPGQPPGPEVEVHPAFTTALVGTPVEFTAQSWYWNGVLSLQWCRVPVGDNTCQDIAGATGSSYSIAAVNLADDGAVYRVVARDSNGTAQAEARLAVSATPGLAFEDGDFQLADWLVSPIVGPDPIRPVHSEERVDSGGNPGAFRRMVFDIPQGTRTAYVAYLSPSSTYDPAAQGAIYVIDYAEDISALSTVDSWPEQSGLVVEQGGRTYVFDSLGGPMVQSSWRTVVRASLRAQDFLLFDGNACGVGEACPDFSASALPMRFGYWRTVSGPPGSSVAHGIDNWKVTVWRR